MRTSDEVDDTGSTTTFRTAGPAGAEALRELERSADPVALAHVLPPELEYALRGSPRG